MSKHPLDLPSEVVEVGALLGVFAISTAIVAASVAARIYGEVSLAVATVAELLTFSPRRS